MNIPTKEQLLAAIATTGKLLPAPRTLGRALQLLRDPDSGLEAIAELIRADSALAADVLRYANSAYYNRQAKVSVIGEAVQVIGVRETTRLLSLAAVQQTTHRHLGSYGIAAEDFWAESLCNGLFLETLAARAAGIDAGEAYTTGLLRFIGRLAIDQALQDLGSSLFWDGAQPLAEWEREYVGLTQAEVGARLLRDWNFPETMVQAVGAQDAVGASDEAPGPLLVRAAHFAAQVLPAGRGRAILEASEHGDVFVPEDHPFARNFALNAAAIHEVCREAHRAFRTICESLYRDAAP